MGWFNHPLVIISGIGWGIPLDSHWGGTNHWHFPIWIFLNFGDFSLQGSSLKIGGGIPLDSHDDNLSALMRPLSCATCKSWKVLRSLYLDSSWRNVGVGKLSGWHGWKKQNTSQQKHKQATNRKCCFFRLSLRRFSLLVYICSEMTSKIAMEHQHISLKHVFQRSMVSWSKARYV